MRELDIKGGNWSFEFEQPVLAYAVFEISSFPDGKKKEITTFISDTASKNIDLFFMNSPFRIGGHSTRSERVEKTLKIKISMCKETEGTRIVYYTDKFSSLPWSREFGQEGDFKPSVALNPELKKEYILAYVCREGDPFKVKATISFIESKNDIEQIEQVDLNGVRDWKEAGEI